MSIVQEFVLPCLWAFAACLGFSILFDAHGIGIVFTSLGGCLGWLVYLVALRLWGGEGVAALVAGIVIAAFAEVMARVRKCPATSYLLVAIFPLVPGLGLYRTMERYLLENGAAAAAIGRETLAIAGGLALGILVGASFMRMVFARRANPTPKRKEHL